MSVIELAERFHRPPHEVYEDWPAEWVDLIFEKDRAEAEAAQALKKEAEAESGK